MPTLGLVDASWLGKLIFFPNFLVIGKVLSSWRPTHTNLTGCNELYFRPATSLHTRQKLLSRCKPSHCYGLVACRSIVWTRHNSTPIATNKEPSKQARPTAWMQLKIMDIPFVPSLWRKAGRATTGKAKDSRAQHHLKVLKSKEKQSEGKARGTKGGRKWTKSTA